MERAREMISQVGVDVADVICLPELFQDLYPAQTNDAKQVQTVLANAETIPGPTTAILSEMARKFHSILVGGSLVERGEDGQIYNTAPIFDETGNLLGKYRKLHIPHYPLYWEGAYFTPGNLGVQAFPTRVGKIAMGICFDQWFPGIGQVASLLGADLLLFPTAIGTKPASSLPDPKSFSTDHWPDMWVNAHRAQAVPNMIAVGAANRVGVEGDLQFFGNSPIIDYTGRDVVTPMPHQEQVTVGTIDMGRMRAERKAWGLGTRIRPDLLEQIREFVAHAKQETAAEISGPE